MEIIETSTSGNTETQEHKETSSDDLIYEESDDVSPLQIYYNKDNLPTVIDEEDIVKDHKIIKPKKSYLRDVRSSKLRRSK